MRGGEGGGWGWGWYDDDRHLMRNLWARGSPPLAFAWRTKTKKKTTTHVDDDVRCNFRHMLKVHQRNTQRVPCMQFRLSLAPPPTCSEGPCPRCCCCCWWCYFNVTWCPSYVISGSAQGNETSIVVAVFFSSSSLAGAVTRLKRVWQWVMTVKWIGGISFLLIAADALTTILCPGLTDKSFSFSFSSDSAKWLIDSLLGASYISSPPDDSR